MSRQLLAVRRTGLVTSVGLSAPAACAAIRAKIKNPIETRFLDRKGEWIMSHSVPLGRSVRGLAKLVELASMSAEECVVNLLPEELARIPLLLCVAESTRPGRIAGLDEQLLETLRERLGGAKLAPESCLIPYGRVGAAVALQKARKLVYEAEAPAVLIVATDSMLIWSTLRALSEQGRLLTPDNSNGFIPGEAGSAVLVARPIAGHPSLHISGLGFASEQASIESDQPLRADGLTEAIRVALQDADCDMTALDFRITDIAGEQYYFKEAALALARTMRRPKVGFDLWHPAECIGEVGSAIGPALLVVAEAAGRKRYAPGPSMLAHAANDSGQRTAIVMRYAVGQ